MLYQKRIDREVVRELAGLARKVAMNRSVLFHGTRHARSILKMGTLFYSFPGKPKVAFTRSPEIAAYFALLQRQEDEGRGAILIFDRQSLQCRYRVEPWHDEFWDDETGRNDEMEERIWQDVTDVGDHLIGLVSEHSLHSSRRLKAHNRAFKLELEARRLGADPAVAMEALRPVREAIHKMPEDS